MFCCFAAIIRASMHWVTPTPGNGAGACTYELPPKVVEALDVNGDGVLDWEVGKWVLRCTRTGPRVYRARIRSGLGNTKEEGWALLDKRTQPLYTKTRRARMSVYNVSHLTLAC